MDPKQRLLFRKNKTTHLLVFPLDNPNCFEHLTFVLAPKNGSKFIYCKFTTIFLHLVPILSYFCRATVAPVIVVTNIDDFDSTSDRSTKPFFFRFLTLDQFKKNFFQK